MVEGAGALQRELKLEALMEQSSYGSAAATELSMCRNVQQLSSTAAFSNAIADEIEEASAAPQSFQPPQPGRRGWCAPTEGN